MGEVVWVGCTYINHSDIFYMMNLYFNLRAFVVWNTIRFSFRFFKQVYSYQC